MYPKVQASSTFGVFSVFCEYCTTYWLFSSSIVATFSMSTTKNLKFVFFFFWLLFMTNIPHSQFSPDDAISLGQWENSHLTHPSWAQPLCRSYRLLNLPVTLSTLSTFIWMDTWSLTPMMQLLGIEIHALLASFCLLKPHLPRHYVARVGPGLYRVCSTLPDPVPNSSAN